MQDEDIPLAATGTYVIPTDAFAVEEAQPESGPLEHRIRSKAWRARTQALEELKLLLGSAPESTFREYLDSLASFVSDPHPGPQEKALELVAIYAQQQPELLQRILEGLVKAIIEKGIASNKTSSKQQATELLVDLFSKQTSELHAYFAGVNAALNSKNLKVQTSAVFALNTLIHNFGLSQVPVQSFLKKVEGYAGASNAQLRQEALNFYKECYLWARDDFLPMISTLKKAQQEELKKQFEELKESAPPRVKSQNKAFDVYETTEPKNIFGQFNERWSDQVLAMSSWRDKKQALEELNAQAAHPKLTEKNASPLVNMIKRLLKDTNMQVVVQAIRLVGLLAKGQRKFFEHHGKGLFPLLIQKLKDKKQPVIQETLSALSALLYSVPLEAILEEIKIALESKTPSVKINLCQWLQHSLVNCADDQVIHAASKVTDFLTKLTDDSLAEVRDSAFATLAFLLQKCPEVVEPAIKELNKAKLKKIKEHSTDSSNQRAASTVTNVAPAKPAASLPRPQSLKVSAKQAPPQTLKVEDELAPNEDAEVLVEAILPAALLSQLHDSNWKTRQSGLQDLIQWIQQGEQLSSEHADALVHFVKKLSKDWKENNFNIIKASFEVVDTLANTTRLSKRTAAAVLTSQALDKLGDSKLAESYTSCLISAAESVGPKFIVSQMLKSLAECTKPKVTTESCSALGRLLSEYGVHTLTLSDVIGFAKHCLNQTNPAIKRGGQNLLIDIYKLVGPVLISQLTDLKENTRIMLEEQFKNTTVVQTNAFRQTRCEETKCASDTPFPRVNLAAQINEPLLKQFADKNWLTRRDALTAVDTLLAKAGFRVLSTGLGPLFKALKGRLADSNKSLIRQAVTLIGKLAESIGSECGKYSKLIIKPLLSSLSDKQAMLRQDAVSTLDKWATQAGAESIVLLCPSHLAQDNPELRHELLTWLLAHRAEIREAKCLLPGIVACLQDRSANIRNSAELLFAEVIDSAGFDALEPLLKDVKPAVAKGLHAIFERYRTEVLPKHAAPKPKTTSGKQTAQPKESLAKHATEELDPLELLKEQMGQCFGQELRTQLFSLDMSQQAEAVRQLTVILEQQPGEWVLKLDVLVKLVQVKLNAHSDTLLKVVLDMCDKLLSALNEGRYRMKEHETSMFLPAVCKHLVSNDSDISQLAQSVIHNTARVSSPARVGGLLLQSFTHKQPEYLEAVSRLVTEFGATVLHPREIKSLAKFIATGDNPGSQAAIDVVVALHQVIGSEIWTLLGDVSAESKARIMHQLSLNESRNLPGSTHGQLNEFRTVIELLKHPAVNKQAEGLAAVRKLAVPSEDFEECSGQLIVALCDLTKHMFDRPIAEVPVIFAMNLVEVLRSCCSSQFLPQLTLEILQQLIEQLFLSLVQPGLDSLGSKNEGVKMMELLNTALLRVLEYSDPMHSYKALLCLLQKHSAYYTRIKLIRAIQTCLLKLAKVTKTWLHRLDVPEILLAVHQYLTDPAAEINEVNEKTFMTIIYELVKARHKDIWTDYTIVAQSHQEDVHISKWITNSLFHSEESPELASVHAKICNLHTYNSGVEELLHFVNTHPDHSLDSFYESCPKELRHKVQNDLIALKQSKQLDSAKENFSHNDFHKKLAQMKERCRQTSHTSSGAMQLTLSELKAKLNNMMSKEENTGRFLCNMKSRLDNLRRP